MADIVENTTPNPIPVPPVNSVPPAPNSEPVSTVNRAVLSRYTDDVAHAMSETDASAIQKFIQDAKDQESLDKERAERTRQRVFFSTTAIILFCIALLGFAYSAWHYKNLTVPLETNVSLGAFPTFPTRINDQTVLAKDIITSVSNDPNFAVGNPILVDIFDPNTGALLSPKELCTFLHIDATEPFETSFAVLRYGLIKTSETQVVPFVVGAVQDDVVASKEFLIAEQKLPILFSQAFNIDPSTLLDTVGGGFTQKTVYNTPIRILHAQKSDPFATTILYGFVQDKIVVFGTDESIIKIISDTLNSQH